MIGCATHPGGCCHPEWSEDSGCSNCGPLPPGTRLGGCKPRTALNPEARPLKVPEGQRDLFSEGVA